MFTRVSILVLAVAAGVIAGSTPSTVNQCNTGTMQCCDQLMRRSDADTLPGLDSLDSSENSFTGIGCSPIIGSASSCSAQTACCTNQQSSGITVFNCSPINVVV